MAKKSSSSSSAKKSTSKPAKDAPAKDADVEVVPRPQLKRPDEKPHPTAAARPATTSLQAAPDATDPEARPKRERGKLIQVEATKMGYYDHIRRRPGDVFDVHEDALSTRWMKRTDGKRIPKITTGNQALKREHDDILALKNTKPGMQTGRDVSGLDEKGRNPLDA